VNTHSVAVMAANIVKINSHCCQPDLAIIV